MWVKRNENKSNSFVGCICVKLYKFPILRVHCIRIIKKVEGVYGFSKSIRSILKIYHGVTIGAYSYGTCLTPGLLPNGTIVGAYCSFASDLKVFRRNHPLDYLSQHPFFYNSKLGLVKKDQILSNEDNPLSVGSDVWIGASVIILPGCKVIGNGAVIGAGSVVTKDVNEFEVVAGNPAKKIDDRYSDEIKEKIILSCWWEKSLLDLLDAESLLISEVNNSNLSEFLKS